jgi:signal transduction histidine kinase
LLAHAARVEAGVEALARRARDLLRATPSTGAITANLGETARQVVGYFESVPKGDGVRFEINVSSDLRLCVPEELAYQALSTLVRNSLEAFEGANRTVRIGAKLDASDVVCEVGDNGPGIDPHLKDRLLAVDVEARKDPTGGRGLRSLRARLERHKCRIELLRSEPGDTLFRVCFPRVSKESAS